MEILELKNTINKIKSSVNRLNSKMELTGKELINLDRTIEITQLNNRGKLKTKQKPQETMGM